MGVNKRFISSAANITRFDLSPHARCGKVESSHCCDVVISLSVTAVFAAVYVCDQRAK